MVEKPSASLNEYHRKRHFAETPEPKGDRNVSPEPSHLQYVIQKHAATRLHYDLRLEFAGVLKSWAVPHGPSLDPTVKSLAVRVEDHPLDYAEFEGTIPKGQYGGGTVMVWDQGTWQCHDDDIAAALDRGKLTFDLHGEKLQGAWTLVRMRGHDSENWLLIKKNDQFAVSSQKRDILTERPRSVLTDRDLSQIADGEKPRKAKKLTKHEPVRKQSKSMETSQTESATNPTPAQTLKRLQAAPLAPLPELLQPQLATLAKRVPIGEDWLHEIKLDGYRMLARIDNGQVTLWTRSGLDWTDRFPTIAEELTDLNIQQAWLDGEIVAEDERGISSFQSLQNALANDQDRKLVYYVFDLPWAEGHDLSSLRLIERKQILKALLVPTKKMKQGAASKKRKAGSQDRNLLQHVRYHDHIIGAGSDVLGSACHLQLEGIISKRSGSLYQHRRTDDWVKNKCQHEQEFVIAGYTKPAGQRTGFGALLLGYYQEEELIYCGRVGTGFTETSLRELTPRLKQLETDECPYAVRPKGPQLRGVTWLEPRLVAEISYATRTSDGILRHSVFHGLREDKPAEQISWEQAVSPKRSGSQASTKSNRSNKSVTTKPLIAEKARGGKARGGATVVTHPERVVYPEAGITKQEIVNYLQAVSDWMLPGIVGRPLALLRCPQGVEQHGFYQKEFDEQSNAGIDRVTIKEKEDETTYAVVKNIDGLIALAQLNTIEFHPWPALAKSLEKPDRLVFDLDPGEGATWDAVIAGAKLVRKLLQQVKLESFVRTTGGKGLHVVAPIKAGSATWDELKAFAKLVSETMAQRDSKHYVSTISKAARRGKVFVDYLRNQRGATAVASFSPRARASAGVAMPISWQSLDKGITNADFTVRTAIEHLRKRRKDPWQEFFDTKQAFPRAEELV